MSTVIKIDTIGYQGRDDTFLDRHNTLFIFFPMELILELGKFRPNVINSSTFSSEWDRNVYDINIWEDPELPIATLHFNYRDEEYKEFLDCIINKRPTTFQCCISNIKSGIGVDERTTLFYDVEKDTLTRTVIWQGMTERGNERIYAFIITIPVTLEMLLLLEEWHLHK